MSTHLEALKATARVSFDIVSKADYWKRLNDEFEHKIRSIAIPIKCGAGIGDKEFADMLDKVSKEAALNNAKMFLEEFNTLKEKAGTGDLSILEFKIVSIEIARLIMEERHGLVKKVLEENGIAYD